MAPKQKRLKIIKVPLDYTPEDHPINFPPYTQLYLELLENKKKVKQELRNKEYVAKMPITTPVKVEKKEDVSSKTEEKKPIKKDTEKIKQNTKKILDFTNYEDKKDDKEEKQLSRDKKKSRPHLDDIEFDNEMKYKDNVDREKDQRNKEYLFEHVSKTEKSHDSDKYQRSEKESIHHRTRSRQSSRTHRSKRDRYEKSNNSKKLDDLLGKSEKSDLNEKHREDRRGDKEDKRKDKREEKREFSFRREEKRDEKINDSNTSSIGSSVATGVPMMPPSLSDIEKGEINTTNFKGVNVQNINSQHVNEEELNKKKELLFRFDILRRSYKGAVIPEYSEYTDVQTMQRSYDETVRRLTLDSKVSTYKSYLVWGFGITEAFLKSIFKLDMDGFAKQQIVQMNSYERLLVELGEKSYLEEKSQWSVEVRLLGTIVFNAAVFIGSKMLLRKTGTDFMNIASDYETSSQPPPQKKKMKGPNINISDLG